MNTEILELEKLSESFLAAVRELQQGNTLTAMDRDLLKHRCLLLYDRIVTLTPTATEPIPAAITVQVPAAITVQEPEIEPVEMPLASPVQQPLFEESMTLNDLAKTTDTPIIKQPPTETEIRNLTIDAILDDNQQKKQEEPVASPDIELSLHEKIAHSMEPKTNLFEKLSTTIPSLKNAINVNLKIALVNQLFNENTVEYVKAIDKLNSCENIHEAMRYFNELKHQYTWDSDDYNVKELEQLLAKRYGS